MSPKGQERSSGGQGQGSPRSQKATCGGRGMGAGHGMGQGGECICPNCGARQPHERAKPCYGVSCPKCGKLMQRA